MASFSENKIIRSEDVFRDIQTEYMIYQINSAADAKKNADKIKRNVEEITKAMEDALIMAQEKKITADDLKIRLSEKKDNMKRSHQEYERAKKHTEIISKKTSNLVTETNKITTVIERIKEAAQGIDPKYIEQSQNDLTNSLVRKTFEAEKAQSDLNAARKIEDIASKKAHDAEIEFNKLESDIFDKVNETERIIANTSITIEHIIKSYDEMAVVSKELLKSATSSPVKIEFDEEEEKDKIDESQLHEEHSDIRVAI